MSASPVPLYRRRWLRWLFVAFAAYSLLGFLVAPWIVRKQLVKQGGVALKRAVAVEAVRMNPWTLSLTIRGLAVKDHDASELAGFDELFVNFQASSLFRREFHFAEIRLVHPRGRFAVNADGSHNLADLVPPPKEEPASPSSSRPPPVGIGTLLVERGAFSYLDRSRAGAFETHFGPTSFELRDFTTRPKRSGAYTFAATTESGERFAWQGSLSFEPLASTGRIGVFAVKLPKYAPFHRELVAVDVAEGQLTLEADYEVSLAGELVARMSNGTMTLENLALRGRAGAEADAKSAPFLTVPKLTLEGVAADSTKRSALITKLVVTGARLEATRRADGTIDVQRWLTPKLPAVSANPPTANTGGPSASASSNLAATSAASSTPWAATLASLEVQNASLRLRDEALPRPASLEVDQIAFTATGASTALDQPVAITAALRWNARGKLALRGTVKPQPLGAELAVEMVDFDLAPLDAYAASAANVAIRSGAIRAAGKLSAAQAPDGELSAHWEGEFGLADLAVEDGAKRELLAGVKDLAVKQVKFDLRPLGVEIAEVAIVEPVGRVAVSADGSNNLSTALGLAKAPAADGAPAPATPPAVPAPKGNGSAPASRPNVKLDRLVISGARFALSDASVSPAFTTELTEFGGTIAGLSSEKSARAVVDLAGKLGPAPLRVSGQINPLSADVFTDVKVMFTGIELPPFTPYSGKFVGYAIERGKLSLELRYQLSGRDVVGENDVVLDQFFLGETVESPTAMKLPLKLALAIMRDADGRIVESLPVRGSLDDPEFRYGRIVMHAVRNIIVKTATAPFSVLGRLFGGGQDLSGVEFAGGSVEFSADGVSRLDALARALKQRPALTLEIVSQPQSRADEPALREAKLLAALQARKQRVEPPSPGAASPVASSATAAAPAQAVLTPEETDRMIAGLFAETFPNYASAVAVAPVASAGSEPVVVTPGASANAPAAASVRVTRRAAGGSKGMRTVNVVVPTPGTSDAAPASTSRGGGVPAGAPAADQPATPALPSVAEMRAQLLPTFSVSAADYADLASRRAVAIRDHLTANGQIAAERVTIAATEPAAGENAAPTGAGSTGAVRVEFTLK